MLALTLILQNSAGNRRFYDADGMSLILDKYNRTKFHSTLFVHEGGDHSVVSGVHHAEPTSPVIRKPDIFDSPPRTPPPRILVQVPTSTTKEMRDVGVDFVKSSKKTQEVLQRVREFNRKEEERRNEEKKQDEKDKQKEGELDPVDRDIEELLRRAREQRKTQKDTPKEITSVQSVLDEVEKSVKGEGLSNITDEEQRRLDRIIAESTPKKKPTQKKPTPSAPSPFTKFITSSDARFRLGLLKLLPKERIETLETAIEDLEANYTTDKHSRFLKQLTAAEEEHTALRKEEIQRLLSFNPPSK